MPEVVYPCHFLSVALPLQSENIISKISHIPYLEAKDKKPPNVCRTCLSYSITTQLDSRVWNQIDYPTCFKHLELPLSREKGTQLVSLHQDDAILPPKIIVSFCRHSTSPFMKLPTAMRRMVYQHLVTLEKLWSGRARRAHLQTVKHTRKLSVSFLMLIDPNSRSKMGHYPSWRHRPHCWPRTSYKNNKVLIVIVSTHSPLPDFSFENWDWSPKTELFLFFHASVYKVRWHQMSLCSL